MDGFFYRSFAEKHKKPLDGGSYSQTETSARLLLRGDPCVFSHKTLFGLFGT
jgi:hypothetical protein